MWARNVNLDSKETCVKQITGDSCMMRDDIPNVSTLTCIVCKENVHYVCSLLPGYFVNLIVKGVSSTIVLIVVMIIDNLRYEFC